MNKQLEIYKKLHGTGKHICQHPNCQTLAMGAYCMVHIETEIAQEWSEIETADKPQQPEMKND
jgi:hypothetical protein